MTIRGDKLAIRVEADLANLSAISSLVSGAMEQAKIDAAIIRKVLLAVDEACTNITLYAYPGAKGFIRKDSDIDEVKQAVNTNSPDIIALDSRSGQNPANYWPVQFQTILELRNKIATDSAYRVVYNFGDQIIYSK